MKDRRGTSLVIQWLRFYTSNTGGAGLIPGQGTKFPHATQRSKKMKEGKNDKRDKPTSSVLKNFSTLGKND